MSDKLFSTTALGVQESGVTGGHITPISRVELSKADLAVMQSNALNADTLDEFHELYADGIAQRVIQPPYPMRLLAMLCVQNNALAQCVSAMEVNIDATGYEIERADGEEATPADDLAIANLMSFFAEPFPGTSFIVFRRKLRRDLERLGNAYIEVLRSAAGEITFLNYLDAITMRLMMLDEPAPVTRSVTRMGKEVTLKMLARERRFVQSIGTKFVYFKEFKSSRDLDKTTGKWSTAGSVPEAQKASEIIHITIDKDIVTAYGVPRWINQVPSVLGSRKAEELNLEFFETGGVPPALIMVQGGNLTPEMRTDVTNYLSGKAKFKQRGLLIEAVGGGTTLGSGGGVRISVERFGSERQNDSLFENYDARCFERVRSAFRLPAMFLGHSSDYSFATAYTSYMVAEAQVFQPERSEFDEIINLCIMKELEPTHTYEFRSKPLTVKDVETQLKALALAKGSVGVDSYVEALNDVTGLTLSYPEEDAENAGGAGNLTKEMQEAIEEAGKGGMQGDNNGIEGEGIITKMDSSLLRELAEDWAGHLSGDKQFPSSAVLVMKRLIDHLNSPVRKLFNGYVAMRMLPEHGHDFDTASELLAAAGECVDREQTH